MAEPLKDDANPVGVAHKSEDIQNYVKAMNAEWDATNAQIPWWKVWKQKSFVRGTDFILKAVDELVVFVDEIADLSGIDKKATVMYAVQLLYEYIIKECLPFWARPFATQIERHFMEGVVSPFIDWLVEKYHSGQMSKPSATILAAKWAKFN